MVVRGVVRDGAIIRATGDVEVWGPVGEAVIVAGRNVVLRGKVVGFDQASIRAGGSIAAISIEEADVAAKDSLFVLNSLDGCRAGARRRVIMGSEGKLVGGTVLAGELLQVAVLGSSGGPPTMVKVATPEILVKWQELRREVFAEEKERIKEAAARLQSGIDALSRRRARRGGQLEPQNEKLLQRMKRELSQNSDLQDELEERMKKIPGREEFARAGRIAGLRKLHSGVTIQMGTINFAPRDEKECQQLISGSDGLTMEWIESCLATF